MSDSDRKSPVLYKRHVSIAQLIKMVHQRPCLWDRTCREYKVKNNKEEAWKQIYREFDPDYDNIDPVKRNSMRLTITGKWYNVRDAYVKSRRSGGPRKPYVYADILTFLDPVIRDRDRSFRDENQYEDDEDVVETESWLNEVFVDVDEGQSATEPITKKVKQEYEPRADNELENEGLVNVLARLIQKEDDEDRAFFRSITPQVKTLSDDKKYVFRVQVMKLLNSLRRKDRPLKRPRVTHSSDTD